MASQKKGETWKIKKWYSVYAPKVMGGDAVIGEFPANDDKAALGRNMIIGLDTITKNPSHAYTNVLLKVTDVNGTTAHTQLVSIRQLYSYIRSLVRRYKSISNSVVKVASKDDNMIVLKMLVVTRSRTTHSKITGMRKEMEKAIMEYAKEKDAKEIITSVIDGSLQANMASSLMHITPISKVEVRALEFHEKTSA
jgi:small subunit ribosomal protein S3Ae